MLEIFRLGLRGSYLSIGHQQGVDRGQLDGAALLPVSVVGLGEQETTLDGEPDLFGVPLEHVDGHLAQFDVDHVQLAGETPTGGAARGDSAPQLGGHVFGLAVHVVQVQFDLFLGLFEQLATFQVGWGYLEESGK